MGDINPLALNLVYLLVNREKLDAVGAIADEYQQLLGRYRGIEQAEVTTAIPLADEERQRLAEHLGAAIGKKVALKTEVDSSLIGGLVIRMDGKLVDGSTRGQLQALKRDLVGLER